MSNDASVKNPIIYCDDYNYLHLFWVRKEETKKSRIFYANNIEGNIKTVQVIEVSYSNLRLSTVHIDSKGRIHLIGSADGDAFYTVRDQIWQPLRFFNKAAYLKLIIDSNDVANLIYIYFPDRSLPNWKNDRYKLMHGIIEQQWLINVKTIAEGNKIIENSDNPFLSLTTALDSNDQINVMWYDTTHCMQGKSYT